MNGRQLVLLLRLVERPRGLDGRLHHVGIHVVKDVERAGHADDPLTRDVGVNHRRFQTLVAWQDLDGTNVCATLDEVGGEAVAERMAMDALVQPRRGLRPPAAATARCNDPS